MDNRQIRDEYLDNAAVDAIGAGTPGEAESLAQPDASAAEKKTARELRETVARMAAASPYMSPPADLRARILATTAPAGYKIEDYKRANRDDAKWWRYGLIAATLFLVAAAYWNMNLQNVMKSRDAEVAALKQSVADQNTALALMADPNSQKAKIRVNEKDAGVLLLDSKNQTAVLIAPQGAFPPGKRPVFEIAVNGEKKSYRTIPVYISGSDAVEIEAGKPIETRLYSPGAPVPAKFGP